MQGIEAAQGSVLGPEGGVDEGAMGDVRQPMHRAGAVPEEEAPRIVALVEVDHVALGEQVLQHRGVGELGQVVEGIVDRQPPDTEARRTEDLGVQGVDLGDHDEAVRRERELARHPGLVGGEGGSAGVGVAGVDPSDHVAVSGIDDAVAEVGNVGRQALAAHRGGGLVNGLRAARDEDRAEKRHGLDRLGHGSPLP